MADKKKAEAKAEEPKDDAKVTDTGAEAVLGKTIDERMAALLKEHKAMGAR